ncbi:MAG TPA: UDP-N-acetylmuramate dehydrogenase [Mariniphaga sp.]|nr:UDP-N-acetylmuramate dehydrogenase [Mariniphaga sp.]
MIRFFENHSIKNYNTFGVDAIARYFFEFTEIEDVDTFVKSNQTWSNVPYFILGGGSNVLFMDNVEGLVLHPNVPGIGKVHEDRQHVWLEVGAGEIWDDFVKYCVSWQLGGVENLSLIPGTVGAAPVQNIGAYGQEVSNVIEIVRGYDLQQKTQIELSAEACNFSYRNSIFKETLKGSAVITSVVFRLEKFPEFKLNYGQVEERVKALGGVNLHNIRQAIVEIRTSKLPDFTMMGNAGSFFKNPVADPAVTNEILKNYPDMPVFDAENGKVKLAAGWLIEHTGLKGYREGNVGVHDKQALVLVNYGGATGKEIYNFSEKVKQKVFKKFGVELEREVNVVA